MDPVVLAARLLLAAVFGTAAVGKLLDLRGSRASLVAFGVPARAAAVLGTVLPFAELAVAVALIPRASAQWGAAGALLLLLTFVAGITNALRKGEAPPCNCFGAIHSAPAGKGTLARNGALAAVAAFVLAFGPGPAIDSWADSAGAAQVAAIVLAVAALVLLVLLVPIWRENRRLQRDLAAADERLSAIPPGLRIGSPAPDFSLPDGEGGQMTLSSLLARGRPVVLVFTLAGCGPCEPMVPALRRLQRNAADRLTVALVGISSIERYDRVRELHGGSRMLVDAVQEDTELGNELDELRAILHRYDVHASPGAVLVTPAGTIASTPVTGRPAIEALIRLTLAGGSLPARRTATASVS